MSKTVAIIGTRGYPSYYGGFETAVRKLAPYLVERGWGVTVYGRKGSTFPQDPSRDPRVHSVLTSGVESKSVSTLSYGLTATIHAWRERPDVALVMNVANGFYLPILKLRGIRTVVNVDGIEWDRAKWGFLAKMMFRAGARFTAWFGDELVYDSEEIARRWEVEFNRTGTFIPYGGDVAEELPVEDGLERRGYVLVVARFVPENTIPEFFEAATLISEHFPVVIVGSSGYGGPLDEQARELSERLDNVHWLGHISDDRRLLALWQHAAVYFHGHSVGGTNPTLVQAMALGTPTVARDTVYNREVLAAGGRYYHPEPDLIAAEVIRMASDPVEQDHVSELNFARSRDVYSWEAVNAAYDELLKRTRATRRVEDGTVR